MKKDPKILLDIPDPSNSEFFQDIINVHLNGYRYTMCLKAALELNLFDKTSNASEISSLANSMDVDEERLGYLCSCLCQMGLLESQETIYKNSIGCELYLTSSSPYNQIHSILFNLKKLERLNILKKSIEEGGIESKNLMFTHDWIKAIGEGAIGGSIGITIKCIENHMDLKKCTSMLDLGGGHGLYAIGFKSKYDNLKCTVFDLPSIIGVAKDNIDDYGMDIETLEGDFFVDDIGRSYDLIFSSFNKSGFDPRMASIVAEHINRGGFLILRRFGKNRDDDPLRDVEWSLYKNLMDKDSVRDFHGDEYLKILSDKGFEKTYGEELDSNTEIIIMKKTVD